jgi:molybdopterin/thiamine biosynthesis adenylyltransferase
MNERFDRHTLIPGWSQRNLTDASVVVVGMGALGNEVSRILAMSGVGELLICDPDTVEVSNLSRTLLFRESDIGRLKVDVAAEALEQLGPGIRIQSRSLPLVHSIGLAELRDASLVLGCLDSRSARLQLAGRCQLVQAPYIDGGTHPWGGEVRPYLEPGGPCYSCSLSAEERAIVDVPWSCLDTVDIAPVGAGAPSSALVGTWMAMVAVRFLMGLPHPGGLLSVDGSRGTTTIVRQQRDPECPLHVPLGQSTTIAVRSQDTVRKLYDALPAHSAALAWEPVQRLAECSNCGYCAGRWGIPSLEACPQCGSQLWPRTTLELDDAPEDLTLASLGVAPREILTVRSPEGLQWFELQT